MPEVTEPVGGRVSSASGLVTRIPLSSFACVCRRKFHGYNSLKEYYEEESCMRYLHRVSRGGTGASSLPESVAPPPASRTRSEHPPQQPWWELVQNRAWTPEAVGLGLASDPNSAPRGPPCFNPRAAPRCSVGPVCSCLCGKALDLTATPIGPSVFL